MSTPEVLLVRMLETAPIRTLRDGTRILALVRCSTTTCCILRRTVSVTDTCSASSAPPLLFFRGGMSTLEPAPPIRSFRDGTRTLALVRCSTRVPLMLWGALSAGRRLRAGVCGCAGKQISVHRLGDGSSGLRRTVNKEDAVMYSATETAIKRARRNFIPDFVETRCHVILEGML